MTDTCSEPSDVESAVGVGAAGKPVAPLALPDEQVAEDLSGAPRSAPIGRPIAPEEYARMKEKAATGPQPSLENAQEDAAE